MPQITNIQQLSKDLLEVYSLLREGKMDAKTAVSLARVAATSIIGAKVVMDYNSVKNTIEKVSLLEETPVAVTKKK